MDCKNRQGHGMCCDYADVLNKMHHPWIACCFEGETNRGREVRLHTDSFPSPFLGVHQVDSPWQGASSGCREQR